MRAFSLRLSLKTHAHKTNYICTWNCTNTHTHTNTKRHKNHHHHHRNIHVHNLLKQNRDIDIIIAGRFLSKEIQRIYQRNSVNRSYMYKSKYIQLCHQFASVHTIHWDIETSSRTHMLHNINCILYKLYIQGIHCFLLKTPLDLGHRTWLNQYLVTYVDLNFCYDFIYFFG